MALTPFRKLETHPPGTSNLVGIVNGNWTQLEAEAAANGGARDGLLAVTYASTITLNWLLALRQLCSLTGNVTVAFSNITSGWTLDLYLKSDSSSRNITWPSGIVWLGTAAPSSIAASKTMRVRFSAITGTALTDVVAEWTVQP